MLIISVSIMAKTKNKLISITITFLLLLSVSSVASNLNYSQSAFAQNIPSVGTFSASGYSGQIFVLPNLILTPNQQMPTIGSILGGNWSFAVNGGKLQDFKWNVELITLNGKVNGTASITGISNSTGIVGSLTNNNIQLSASNGTAFKANADININDRTSFYDVPIVLYLLNGKLVNLSIDSIRTGGLFTTPIFGIVTTLTH